MGGIYNFTWLNKKWFDWEMKLSKIVYKGESRIKVEFPYDLQLVSTIKQIPDAIWSKSLNAWHVPDNKESIDMLKHHFGDSLNEPILNVGKPLVSSATLSRKTEITRRRLSPETEEKIEQYRKWMSHKRYGESTIKTYSETLSVLLRFILPKSPEEMQGQDMVNFVNNYIIPNKYSYAFQNQAVNL